MPKDANRNPKPASAPGACSVRAMRLLIHMAEYLSAAGWRRDGNWWRDPNPEAVDPCIISNNQQLHEAVKMQIARDMDTPNDQAH